MDYHDPCVLLIVMLVIIGFCIVANRVIKHASDVPGTFQNIVELVVEMLDKMVGGVMGKFSPQFRNYISTIFIFILLSNISGLFGLSTDGGLRRDVSYGRHDFRADPLQQVQVSEGERRDCGIVRSVVNLGAD